MNDVDRAEVLRLVAGKTNRPVIRITAGKLADTATEAEQAIAEADVWIYQRGDSLVRPVVHEIEAYHGRKTRVAQLVLVRSAYLRDVLSRVARWQKYNVRKKDWIDADPPHEVAYTMLARFGEWTLPTAAGVITTPTLRPDGSLLCEEGYDPATQLVLVAPPELPEIPAAPTREDALEALALLDALLEEFPLVDEASRAVALSALITPIVRGAFAVAPMHVARAPVPGSGKSYLLDVVAAMAIGQRCPVMAAGRTEEETEKRLGAALLAGQPLISIDNLNDELRGDALCQIIERPVVLIRILGRSERVRIETRGTTLFATGNNLALVGDMVRRAIVASMDPALERPELREFTGDPFGTVMADRGRYIAAALTICRAYIAAGYPDRLPALASFEGWSDTVRSALVWLGCADPVETMELARADDPERAALAALLAAWRETFGVGWVNRSTAAEAIAAAEQRDAFQAGDGDAYDGYDRPYRHPELREAIQAVTAARGPMDATRLGLFLRKVKGRIVDGLRFDNEPDHHGARWWVDEV